MAQLDIPELLDCLHQCGLIDDVNTAEVVPLDGGVSSSINIVRTAKGSFVIKQALEKLKVKDDWRCDPVRNVYEQEYMELAHQLVPGSVPVMLCRDPERGFFAMEFLGGEWTAWKARLWEGETSEAIASEIGRVLGELHGKTWEDKAVASRFDNTPLFHDLRIAPYLLTTAERQPELRELFEEEAERLAGTRLALVHGDYSPKNFMTDGRAVKILDAEVAWFGDPAFDIAFLSNHLFLKAVRFPDRAEAYLALHRVFLASYRDALGFSWSEELETRSARLMLMLMIARISGKSPVEYFSAGDDASRFIVQFASQILTAGARPDFAALSQKLSQALSYENHPR